ncbi:MAG: N-acetylmuramoyl-L-alanine amidase [Saprospiraceae bacterium]|nr:N-acetylmuramoyl-L-alanine amidase [Candidatus Brachybacter algidus]
MATNTQAVFEKKYEEQGNRKYTGTVKSRDLYVVKYSAPPALFVELGNIQNVNDQKRFLKSENRQSLADWLYEGFTK